MRTTITLEDDVEALLKRAQAELKQSPKQIINEALRDGLPNLTKEKRAVKRKFVTKSVSLGACLLPNLDNVAEILAITEGDKFR
ncbi:MAG TPA: antitoxin [Myxococcota bacterium]|nr:antitoxin [Myxococcota bacterium]